MEGRQHRRSAGRLLRPSETAFLHQNEGKYKNGEIVWLRFVLTDLVLQGLSVLSVSSWQFEMLTGWLDESMGTVNLLVTGSWICVNWFYPPLLFLKIIYVLLAKDALSLQYLRALFWKNTHFRNPMYYEIIHYVKTGLSIM